MTATEVVGFAARWLAFVGVIVPLGAVLFCGMVIARSAISSGDADRLRIRAARVGRWSALLILPAALARLYFQVGLMRFPDEPWVPFATKLVTRTSWGYLWLGQIGLASLVAAALWRAEQGRPSAPWRFAAFLATCLVITPSLSNHAMSGHGSRWITLPADMLHLIGAAAWLGTLAALFVATGLNADEVMPALLARFSPLALFGATTVALSGTISSLVHIEAVKTLTMTPYGRALLIKLCLVAAVAAFGWRNWRHMTPRLGEIGSSPLRRSIAVELVLTALVLGATSVLVITPPPMAH
jgi:putative copper export protein